MTLSNEGQFVLHYKGVMPPDFRPAAALLREHLIRDGGEAGRPWAHLDVIGRGRRQMEAVERPCMMERMPAAPGLEVCLEQPDNAFANPNPHICLVTMQWLMRCAQSHAPQGTNLLELYSGAAARERNIWWNRKKIPSLCRLRLTARDHFSPPPQQYMHPGAGTYTPAMASVFETVTCVEFNIRLVQAARENAQRNNVAEKVRGGRTLQSFEKSKKATLTLAPLLSRRFTSSRHLLSSASGSYRSDRPRVRAALVDLPPCIPNSPVPEPQSIFQSPTSQAATLMLFCSTLPVLASTTSRDPSCIFTTWCCLSVAIRS